MKLHTQQAFSLYELMIALALASIFASIALPAFSSLRLKNDQDVLRNSLHASLNHARAQAILRNTRVDFCPLTNTLKCGNDWRLGWMSRIADSQEMLEAVQQPSLNALLWAGFEGKIRFHSNGTSPTGNGRFYQCHNGSVSWQLVLNRQGRVRNGTRAENQSLSKKCP
ncbi:GspH/FimT family pseudopilin [Pseudomonas sp. PDM14]|uniref:GspH/FimT family pseudopilin n=1 Tax=Pseudomonas sp. PDM14 TaxID=2769288 RepID=UPI00177B1C54|nr:GspH/FimT family pseudopilin [Pseudomonas sp. PDM14]MBD9485378.1 GspH/FimT family pseudopilin [Pseudomonas sp. PDM14]